MNKITVKIEGEPRADDRGYERRETLAELSLEVSDLAAWHVYGNAVEYLTTPTMTVSQTEERVGW